MKPSRATMLFSLLVILTTLLGCAGLSRAWPSPTPLPPAVSSTQVQASSPAPPSRGNSAPQIVPSLWLADSLPAALRQAVTLPAAAQFAQTQAEANLTLDVAAQGGAAWVYALVAPFPTIVDEVTLDQLQAAWNAGQNGVMGGAPLHVSASTLAAFSVLWGAPAPSAVQVMDAAALIPAAWADPTQPFWAIIPFEELEPRWKVLRVNGLSPYDKPLDLNAYPLLARFAMTGDAAALAALEQATGAEPLLPTGNRDESQMTVLVMTGVTALVRSTAGKMEANGMTYPGRDIRDWLRSADLTHISNEIAFTPICPPANPYQDSLQFCSRPEYIELLEDVGADIIDMTGNHMLDYNQEPLLYTLEMYRERGWGFYASGENLAAAQKPLLVENNGNKLAFIGCNPVGPTHAWATDYSAGIAPCDYEYMHAEISRLRDDGYLPVVTFQYHEYYTPEARPGQALDFEGMAQAGAVVVSGSQAHVPQAFGFYGNQFIHYGLGNLFFDQMDIPVVGTRREFLDRHVFYQGRYLGVELLTAMLEDYARPRPMTLEDRQGLLSDIFAASDWSGALRQEGQ